MDEAAKPMSPEGQGPSTHHPSPSTHRLLLLLPATTYRGDAFLEAAQRLNLAVTIGTEHIILGDGHKPADILALNFHDHAAAVRTVMEYNRNHPIDAIIGVEDATVVL